MFHFEENALIHLTGTLSRCSRLEFEEIVAAMGCDIAGSLSRRTVCLVAGDNAKEEKILQAERLGVPVLREAEFWAAVDAQYQAK